MELTACDQPWFELQLEYNGLVRNCCYWNAPEDSWHEEGLDIERLWNSPLVQRRRAIVASGDARGTGCYGCQYLKYASDSRFLDIPTEVNSLQRANWELAKQEFLERRTTLQSMPVKYYMNFGLACNFECIHCCQTAERAQDRRQLAADALLARREYLRRANEFAIIGGEPLAVRNARQFIDGVLADDTLSDVRLTLYTNGSLLHQVLDRLQAQRRVGVCVSLESLGPTLERIRPGARWEVIERNLLEFRALGARQGLSWTVNIAAVVMKSAIPELPDFVAWCCRNDFPMHFVPLQSQTARGFDTDGEDIFNFPSLLEEIPDWEDRFDAAIEICRARGWVAAAAGPLAMMKDELKAKLELSRKEREVNALRARLGTMLGNANSLSLDELGEATRAVNSLARASNPHALARTSNLPKATLPLLQVSLEKARAAANVTLVAGLERLCDAVIGASDEPLQVSESRL